MKVVCKKFLVIAISGLFLHIGTACSGAREELSEIDPREKTTISEGDWIYNRIITNPGTRSEGSIGHLLYKNEPVPVPENLADYYDTPIGIFFYVQDDGRLWGDKQWVLSKNSIGLSGKALPLPNAEPDPVGQEKKNMDRLVSSLKERCAEPQYCDELEFETELDDKDAWGTAYRIFFDRRGGEGSGDVVRLVLKSAGPDKAFGSKDDIERYSSFFPIRGEQQTPDMEEEPSESPAVSEEPS